MSETELEIVVVDDGSTDDSLTCVTGLTDPRIIICQHLHRRGSGAARRTGVQASTGDIVVWIDGDGTYTQSDLGRLTELIGPYDQVIGVRQADFGEWLLLRRLVKWAINRSVSALWRARIPDVNSGLRAFKRASIMQILNHLPDGFSCATTATLSALNRGHQVAFFPISYHPRSKCSRSKFHPVFDTLRLLRVIVAHYVGSKSDYPSEDLRQNKE
jgi:polyisoprenyl-phosphate glycosyltransferase